MRDRPQTIAPALLQLVLATATMPSGQLGEVITSRLWRAPRLALCSGCLLKTRGGAGAPGTRLGMVEVVVGSIRAHI